MTGVFPLLFYLLVFSLSIQGNVDEWSASNPLTIHVIPHSHCDPGWLKTYKEYYAGHVKSILTGVIKSLREDPNKTFIWAEISFFKLWWESQNLETKEAVKELVARGQFEFVGGGWVQNDEAAASVELVLNQISEGHDYLLRQFSVRPKVAWQIDPFGHSSLTPTLFSQIGYKALVINRIHYQLKQLYKEQRDMEFVWRASNSLGSKAEIFTHILHTHYSAPQTFDWEENSVPVTKDNIHYRADYFVTMLKQRSATYRTNQLLVAWGDDFKFQNALLQFSNMDKLIDYINSNVEIFGVRVLYSTLDRYFSSVEDFLQSDKGEGIQFSRYYGDFFPYADNEDSYWTGYYTTRPALKGFLRETLSILRAAEMVYALARSSVQNSYFNWDKYWFKLKEGRMDSSLVAHHDGVTGTSRSYVVEDYLKKLHEVHSNAEETIIDCMALLLRKEAVPQLSKAQDLFELGNDISYPLVFYNSLGWKRRQIVLIRVNSVNVQILDFDQKPVEIELFPVWGKDEFDFKLQTEVDIFDLVFVVEIPAAGLATYFLTTSKKSATIAPYTVYVKDYMANVHGKMKFVKPIHSDIFIENNFTKIGFESTGEIKLIGDKIAGEERSFHVGYFSYSSIRSGAYIFRSDQKPAYKLQLQDIKLYVIKGKILQQVIISSAQQVQIVRLYNTSDIRYDKMVEIIHKVSPTTPNTELVVRYSNDLSNADLWTDNGLELRPRVIRDIPLRPETNYFPMQTTAALRNQTHSITVLVKQPNGVTYDKKGTLEIAIHRRLEQDDGRGLSEPVRDDTRTTQPHWILFTKLEENDQRRHELQLMLEHPLRMSFGIIRDNFEDWKQKYHTLYSPLTDPLPENLHLFSLSSRDATSDEVVIRLNHLFERDEHPILSKSSTIDLHSFFSNLELSAFRQLSLSLNNEPREMYQVHFPVNNVELLPLSGTSQAPKKGSDDKQNSDEEGVFLSKIALEEAKNKTKKLKKDRQNSDEEGVFLSKIALENANNSISNGRKLLNHWENIPLTLKPLEMVAFSTVLELKDKDHYKYKPEEQEKQLSEPPPIRIPGKQEIKLEPKNQLDMKSNNEEILKITEGKNKAGIDPSQRENLSSLEVKIMLLMTSLGILLILGVFLKLQTRRIRVLKDK